MKFIHDIKRYLNPGAVSKFKNVLYLLFIQGIWAIAVYRFGAWCAKFKLPAISQLFRISYFFMNKIIEITTGISISSKAEIGEGFYVGHFGQIFIHPNVTIGKKCNIGQGVTIGTLGLGRHGTPKIGNNVYIGTGAKILGDICIGSNVRIGANAVVIKDIPDNSTAVGVPARVIKTY